MLEGPHILRLTSFNCCHLSSYMNQGTAFSLDASGEQVSNERLRSVRRNPSGFRDGFGVTAELCLRVPRHKALHRFPDDRKMDVAAVAAAAAARQGQLGHLLIHKVQIASHGIVAILENSLKRNVRQRIGVRGRTLIVARTSLRVQEIDGSARWRCGRLHANADLGASPQWRHHSASVDSVQIDLDVILPPRPRQGDLIDFLRLRPGSGFLQIRWHQDGTVAALKPET
mmetsp:Transcript_63366/g.167921  ORF Transcript_63366/g.167921 Transcript_63366/m.167921 type:complete len:228 (+) Transcript_63366:519-1202(+)